MRLGIDLGGTKIEIVALGDDGKQLTREREPTPDTGYNDTVKAITNLVRKTEAKLGMTGSLGVGIPGTISAATHLVKNANSTQLIGHPLDRDLGAALNRPVRVANDANCFTLSEASDGAAANCSTVFGIIAGTGVGGGVYVNGKVLAGAHSIAGEWGHNPMPIMEPDEFPGPLCYCGRTGCIEAWCSGPALSAQFEERTGRVLNGAEIAEAAANGDIDAQTTMNAFLDRFARAIATVVNVLDPDAIVIGGGVSNIGLLYSALPPLVEQYAFTPEGRTRIVKSMHGDSSGVRGAAWLWRIDERDKALPK